MPKVRSVKSYKTDTLFQKVICKPISLDPQMIKTWEKVFFDLLMNCNRPIQFARVHTSSLIKIDKTMNRTITKFYNGDDVNVIAAELRLTQMRPTSFNKK